LSAQALKARKEREQKGANAAAAVFQCSHCLQYFDKPKSERGFHECYSEAELCAFEAEDRQAQADQDQQASAALDQEVIPAPGDQAALVDERTQHSPATDSNSERRRKPLVQKKYSTCRTS